MYLFNFRSFFIIPLIVVSAHAQNFVTNGAGSLVLNNTNFVGTSSQPAGDIRNFDSFETVDVSYEGYVNSVSATDASGGVGLRINDNQTNIINNTSVFTISGGSGSQATSAGSGISTVLAEGGIGLQINNEHDPLANFYGGPGNQEIDIVNAVIQGGGGGSVTGLNGNTVSADGGTGLFAENITVSFNNVSISGGDGGAAQGVQGDLSADGGHGILTGYNINLGSLSPALQVQGGHGGTVTSSSLGQSSTANGGNGFDYQGLNLDLINYPQPRDSSLTNVIDHGTFIGGNGGTVVGQAGVSADGGRGLFSTLQIMTVSNGTFRGGAGGSVTAASLNEGTAQGGDGFYSFENHHLKIVDGDYYGGIGGSVNGISQDSGAGLRAIDTDMTVLGGNFYGNGLVFSNATADASLDIQGGVFDTIEFGGDASLLSSMDISGGTMSNVLLHGSSSNLLTFSGGSIDKLSLAGSGDNTLSFSGNGVITEIQNISGDTQVNEWIDDHFLNTIISGGSLTFKDQNFQLASSAIMSLTDADSYVNFTGSNTTLKAGSILNLGSGEIHANTLVAEQGSTIKTIIYEKDEGGYANGVLNVETLNINPNTNVKISNTVANLDFNLIPESRFLLVNSTNDLDLSVIASESGSIELEGFEWIYDIIGFSTGKTDSVNSLYANAGINLDSMITKMNASGDLALLLNEMESNGNILGTNLTTILNNKADFSSLTNILYRSSANETSDNLTKNFFRSTEIANALLNSQSVLSDQIMARTRDHFRSYKSSMSMPNGPINWFNSFRKNVPVSRPSISSRNRTNKLPINLNIEVSSEFNTWGRAFISDLQQNSTPGFAGYDAYISGGIVGLDKRTNRSLIGIAGGINKTTINGLDDHDGDIESLHGTLYLSQFYDSFCLNAHLSLVNNDIESMNAISGYSADYNAKNISSFIGLSTTYKILDGAIIVSPELSLLSTKFYHNGYNSSSSLGIADMKFDSYKFWSHKSELGVIALPSKKIDSERLEMAFQPEFRLHWVHDFNTEPDNETYHFMGSNQKYNIELQHREKNLTRLGSGIKCWDWRNQSTVMGLDLDYFKGDIYSEWMFSGHLLHRF